MLTPIIITNFKIYESASSDRALRLAKIHDEVARETGVSIAIAVSAVDLFRIAKEVSIPVFAQNVEAFEYGAFTGHIAPRAVREAGAFGTLLNHSECRVGDLEKIKKIIEMAKAVGLEVVVCAENPEEGQKIAKFNADMIAVEPPELIGGDISVSTAQPEVIAKAVKLIGKGKVLVGAGVKTGRDVQKAIELGASGVLLASGVTNAKDPKRVLLDLASGIGMKG